MVNRLNDGVGILADALGSISRRPWLEKYEAVFPQLFTVVEAFQLLFFVGPGVLFGPGLGVWVGLGGLGVLVGLGGLGVTVDLVVGVGFMVLVGLIVMVGLMVLVGLGVFVGLSVPVGVAPVGVTAKVPVKVPVGRCVRALAVAAIEVAVRLLPGVLVGVFEIWMLVEVGLGVNVAPPPAFAVAVA